MKFYVTYFANLDKGKVEISEEDAARYVCGKDRLDEWVTRLHDNVYLASPENNRFSCQTCVGFLEVVF